MATEDISLRVRLDQVESALRSIPGMTEASMKRVASAAAKEWKEVEKAAKIAAKAQEKAQAEAAKKIEKDFEEIKKGATVAFGGVVGDIEDVAGALGALGPVGGTVAAAMAAAAVVVATLPAAALAAVVAIDAMVSSASEAAKRLNEMGGARIITDEQIQRVRDAEDAIEAAKSMLDELWVLLVSDASPAIQNMTWEFAALTLEAIKAADAYLAVHDIVEETTNFLVEMALVAATLPVSPLVAFVGVINDAMGKPSKLADEFVTSFAKMITSGAQTITGLDGLDNAQGKLSARAQELKDKIEANKKEHEAAAVAAKNHAAATRMAAAAAAEERAQLAAQQKSLSDLTQMWDGYVQATQDRTLRGLSEQDKITAGYEAELQKIRSLTEAAKDLATTQEQVDAIIARGNVLRSAATDEYVAKLEELDAKIAESGAKQTEVQVTAAETALKIWADYYAEVGKYLSEQLDKFASTYGMIIDKIGQIGQAWEDLQRQRLDAIMEERMALIEAIKTQSGADRAASVQRLKATRDEANETRQAVARGFRVAQAAAVAAAIVDAARSAVALIPAFSFLGPGAPFAAAGVAGGALAIQLATIKGQQPKFHSGLDPSETPAIITRGEGVANARAMSQPGFGEALRAANAGIPSPAQGPIVLALNDRVLSTLDARTRRISGRDVPGRSVVRLGVRTHYTGG